MKSVLRFAFVGLVALLLAACGSAATATPQAQTANQPLTAGVQAQPESSGRSFEFQYACVAENSRPCRLIKSFFIPRVEERTNGRLQIDVTSFIELGLAGPGTLRLVEDGTLDAGEILSVYIAGEVPITEIDNLLGLFPDAETQQRVTDAVREDIERIISERTGGGQILAYQYYDNLFFFSKIPFLSLEDFKDRKIRQPGGVLGDLIAGLGANGQFIAVSEVHTTLELGIVEAAVTAGSAGLVGRLHEVTGYLVGPIVSRSHSWMTVNGDSWNALPAEFQQILLEVGKEYEEENLRLLEQWNQEGIDLNVAGGMEHIPFTPEVAEGLRLAAVSNVVPGWVSRVGGPDSEGAKLFNAKVAPLVNVVVNPDGTASEID